MGNIQERKYRRSPHLYGRLIFDKGAKNDQWGKKSLFSWENHMQKSETRPLPSIGHKDEPEMDERPDAVKFPKENIGKKFPDIILGNDLFEYNT